MTGPLRAAVIRLGAGTVAGAGAGLVAFLLLFRVAGVPGPLPWGHVLLVAIMSSAILALVHAERHETAVLLIVAVAGLQCALAVGARGRPGWTWTDAVLSTAGSVVLGGALFAASVIWDRLASAGIGPSKSLFLGPLIGGACLAVTPLTRPSASAAEIIPALWMGAFLGMVVGDGVGLGVELADLADSIAAQRRAGRPPATSLMQ